VTAFVTFWDGSPLTHFEMLCLASFLDRGHAVELYTYTPFPLPARLDGVLLKDAAEVLPRDAVVRAMLAKGQYSRVANLFRYRALGTPGRTWVDVDIYLLPSQLPPSEVLFGLEDDFYVNNAVLRLPPEHPLRVRLVQETSSLDPVSCTEGSHGTFGPRLLTDLVDELGLRSEAFKQTVLYPIASRDLWRLFDPRERTWCEMALETSSTLHLWNEFLRRADARGLRPARGSWLDRAMRRHGIEQPKLIASVKWVRGPLRQVLPDPPVIEPRQRPFRRRLRVTRRRVVKVLRFLASPWRSRPSS
jgi:hypothetical protein